MQQQEMQQLSLILLFVFIMAMVCLKKSSMSCIFLVLSFLLSYYDSFIQRFLFYNLQIMISKAFRLFQKAGDKGLYKAKYNMGACYDLG